MQTSFLIGARQLIYTDHKYLLPLLHAEGLNMEDFGLVQPRQGQKSISPRDSCGAGRSFDVAAHDSPATAGLPQRAGGRGCRAAAVAARLHRRRLPTRRQKFVPR